MIRQVNLDTTKYRGLSSDSRPEGAGNGSTFLEIDTGAEYMYDEENEQWRIMPDGSGGGGGDNTEVVSARTGADGTRYGSLKGRLDAENEDLNDKIDGEVSLLKSQLDALPDDGVTANAKQLLTDKGITESVPYLFRRSGGDGADREYDTLVGGTVAWNQLAPISASSATATSYDVTLTDNRDGTYVLTGTSNAAGAIGVMADVKVPQNHVFAVFGLKGVTGSTATFYFGFAGLKLDVGNGGIWKNTTAYSALNMRLDFASGITFGNVKLIPQVFDITQMFGSTIADYIYDLETAHAGDGVAFFRSLFQADYYPYDSGSLKSVEGVSAHVTTGFNQWDEEWDIGDIDGITGAFKSGNYLRSKNMIPVLPGTAYYLKIPSAIVLYEYDASKNVIPKGDGYSYHSVYQSSQYTTGASTRYIAFRNNVNLATQTYSHDICINLSDPAKNGTYEPYNGHTYALDDSLTLRGIPKLDSNNALYFDGDTYAADGTVTRRYGVVDLGTLTWTMSSSYQIPRFGASVPGMTNTTAFPYYTGIVSAKYKLSNIPITTVDEDRTIARLGGSVFVCDSRYTDPNAFKAAMSGVMLVYELATPTTESAEPFQSPQICSPYGTEEYITTGVVPVGHSTFYPENLRAKIEELPSNFSTLIAPTESTFTASRNYTTGALFIVQNVLYKATANIANGGTITPGTNCTATTLAEIISALS